MAKSKNKISVRLTSELLNKMNQWRSCGYHMSDIVRHALALLPASPDQQPTLPVRIKPMSKQSLQIELKDEKVALKSLQNW
jgi:Arc/MetJ-type ribon-helix-helix transcriptional regulator